MKYVTYLGFVCDIAGHYEQGCDVSEAKLGKFSIFEQFSSFSNTFLAFAMQFPIKLTANGVF